MTAAAPGAGPVVAGIGISVRADDPRLDDLARNLDWADGLGVDWVELPTLAMDLVADGRILKERLQRALAIVSGRRFRYSAHGPIGINLMSAAHHLPLHERVLAASIEVAAELGAERYVVHTGHLPSWRTEEAEAAYAVQRDALARAGDIARDHGVLLVVENIFTSRSDEHTALPSRLAAEIARIGHPSIAACIDFSHAFITSSRHGADIVAEVAALGRVARHLHLHDSFGRPREIETFSLAERLAFGQGDLHLPVGWGSIPWDRVMSALRLPAGVVFNIELEQRYWPFATEAVAAVRHLAGQAQALG